MNSPDGIATGPLPTRLEAELSEPVVDIGIPTRGQSPYLQEAIESVLTQTLGAWRLLVAENGPGEAAETVEPYLGDRRIQYVANGSDLGAAANHTKLIQSGSARFVGVLHDDDRWEPDFLARRVFFLENHPACGLVFGANVEIDTSGSLLGRSKLVLPEGLHPPQEVVPRLLAHNLIAVPTVLVRRSAYEAVGPVFDDRFIAFDYEMWLRLATRFPVGYLHVWDAASRVHDLQRTFQLKHTGQQWLGFLGHAEALVRRELPELQLDRRQLRRKRSGAHLSVALDMLDEGNRRGSLALLWQALRIYPLSASDPRFAAGLTALALGDPGRRALAHARYLVNRRRIRLHLRAIDRRFTLHALAVDRLEVSPISARRRRRGFHRLRGSPCGGGRRTGDRR
jgi:glycosyltransferase involved in cell wall biosynthesis